MTEAALTTALYETHEIETNEIDIKYPASDFATSFLGRFVRDEKLQNLELTFEAADQLAAGIIRLRGPFKRSDMVTHDYTAILTSLLSPDGSAQFIAQEVLGTTDPKDVHIALRSLSTHCRRAAPHGISLDMLRRMGDPEYQPDVTPQTAHELGGVASLNVGLLSLEPLHFGPVVQKDESDYPADEPLAWQVDALCAQTSPEAFFPEKGGSTRDAKHICESCEVRNICLRYALNNDERFGIWGGVSERERRKLKNRRTA